MANTKEKILQAALNLFAKDGYEAVSVSMIAGALGITKGALYKHYANKRAIFDSIIERMYRLDADRSQRYNMPQVEYKSDPQAYRAATFEAIQAFTTAQLQFWTEDAFASSFRKMLVLEQYRNPEMAKLYHSCLTEGPVGYMADIFGEMVAKGALKQTDPKELAVTFYAPLYLLIATADNGANAAESALCLNRHIERFIQTYAT